MIGPGLRRIGVRFIRVIRGYFRDSGAFGKIFQIE
jgi:hypothetical protein